AIAGPLLGLLGNEPRRAIALVGSGAVAVAAAVLMNGFQVQSSTFAIAAVAAVLATAPARAGAALAMTSIAGAMRTDDLAEMGDAWRRMRATSGAFLASVVAMALAVTGALAFGIQSRSYNGFALGIALLLIAIGGVRLFLGASFGPLRRRRAFEPDRVRETTGPLVWRNWLPVPAARSWSARPVGRWLNSPVGRKTPPHEPARR